MILRDFYIVKRMVFCNEMAQEIYAAVLKQKDFSALCKSECLCHFLLFVALDYHNS